MSKLPNVGTTIFSVMSKMALDHQAINLSQGFPNFPVDPLLQEIYKKQVDANVHQYAPMPGNMDLLGAISALIAAEYKRTCSPETELLVTAGATQAIFTIIQALIGQKDEVVILDPCYDCYDPAIRLAGGTPVHIPLTETFLPDWDRIDSALTEKTRMLIINNPHNPSGRIWEEQDFAQLESILKKYPDVLVLSDEVYEFITFDRPHISAHHRPELHDRTLIVSSFGKTFHITGWKVGYIAAPAGLMAELKKVHQFLVFSVNSVAQAALANYLPNVKVNELGAFYRQKRDLFRSLLQDSRFELLPSEGSYFQVARYTAISNEDDIAFTRRLVMEHQVATIPLSVFSEDGRDLRMIRFCFAKTDDTLIQAAEKLCKI